MLILGIDALNDSFHNALIPRRNERKVKVQSSEMILDKLFKNMIDKLNKL